MSFTLENGETLLLKRVGEVIEGNDGKKKRILTILSSPKEVKQEIFGHIETKLEGTIMFMSVSAEFAGKEGAEMKYDSNVLRLTHHKKDDGTTQSWLH